MKPLDFSRLLVRVAVVFGAVLAAFFVTFNSLFSDGPTGLLDGERLGTYGISLVAHGLLAASAARWGGWSWTWAAVAAAGPSVGFALLYAMSEPGIAAFAVLYAVLAILGASLGALAARPKLAPA